MASPDKITAAVSPVLIAGVMVLALAALPGSVGASEGKGFDYPKGIAGEIAEAYIETFGTGVDSLMAGFYETHLSLAAADSIPVKTRVWEYHRLYNLFGELVPHSVVERGESVLVLLVESEKLNIWFHMSVEMDEATPGRLLDIDVQPAAGPE